MLNVGHKFLNLLHVHFSRGSILYPICNRYKVKLSYRCMPNMGMKISQHNSKLLRKQTVKPVCNCREPVDCPLPGRCTTDNVVYRATVTTNNSLAKYVGLTSQQFKARHANHEQDFKNPEKEHATTLSAHIWELKRKNTAYNIKFDIVRRATPFSPVSGVCNLCTAEKYEILFKSDKAHLNSR